MREPQFHRIRRLPPYVFSEVNAMKAAARSAPGATIIDFGMGNPDQPASKAVVDKLIETVKDPKTHRYSTSRGITGLRRAQGRLLRQTLRRDARSGERDHRHPRLERGARQSRPGDAPLPAT